MACESKAQALWMRELERMGAAIGRRRGWLAHVGAEEDPGGTWGVVRWRANHAHCRLSQSPGPPPIKTGGVSDGQRCGR